MKVLLYSCLMLYLFVLASFAYADQNVYLNEVAIDRSPQAVELINISTESADVSSWYIDDSGGSTFFTIPSHTTICPHSCIVLEGEFNLNKSTPDTVRLFNSASSPVSTDAVLIDSYPYKSGPGAGNSYARNPDGNGDWSIGITSLGTFNTSSMSCIVTPAVTPTPLPSPSPTAAPTPLPSAPVSPTTPIYPAYEHIIISEVYPYPETGENEWVELYNGNDFEAVLQGWYIDDLENGGGTPRKFSITLAAHGYSSLELTSALFNNDKDSARLLNQDKTQVDGFEYESPRQGKSLGRVSFDSETVCPQMASKGTANTGCIDITPTAKPLSAHVANTEPFPTAGQTLYAEKKVIIPAYDFPTPVNQPSVLGSRTSPAERERRGNGRHVPIPHLTFISFTYSILTIVSLLFKIKNGLT